MQLREYLWETGLSQEAFGVVLGVCQQMVGKVICRTQPVGLALALDIQYFTDGDVTARELHLTERAQESLDCLEALVSNGATFD